MQKSKPKPNGKQFKMLAIAVGALLAGQTIQFEGPNAAEMQTRANMLADALRANKQPPDTLPAAVVGESNHLFASFDWGKFSRFLRRREPIWIGRPRPMNHTKHIASKRTRTA